MKPLVPPPRPPRPPRMSPVLRKVCGVFEGPDGTILHLTCGHHITVVGPREATQETWMLCEECWPLVEPARGRA